MVCTGRPVKWLNSGHAKSLLRYKLKQSTLFLHHRPLTAEVILGYLFAKEVEVRNLMVLGKASALGLTEEFVRNNLVV